MIARSARQPMRRIGLWRADSRPTRPSGRVIQRAVSGSLVVASLAVLLVTGPPASAGDTPCSQYGPRQLAAASMRAGDIPERFGSQPTRAVDYRGCGQTKKFEVCVDKNGRKINGVAPGSHMNVSYTLYSRGSGNNITETVATSSDIYSYPTVSASSRAWNRLTSDIARCAPIVKTQRVMQNIPIDVVVTQRVRETKTVNGFPGFQNGQTVAVDAGSGPQQLLVFVDGFTAYRLAGSTIVRTQFAHYNQTSLASVRLSTGRKRWTAREAVTVANRIAATG